MSLSYEDNKIDQFSRQCYYIGLGIGLIGIISLFLIACLKINIVNVSPFGNCLEKYGFYCFGCGGTRALEALLQGKVLLSLHYHPFVLYSAVIYMAYMLSHTVHIITNGRTKFMRFRPCYFYIAIILIIGQCLIKNISLWRYGFVLWKKE